MVAPVRESIATHIAFLTKQARAVEKQLLKHIKSEPQNVARFELLKSVPGVGALTAAERQLLLTSDDNYF